MDGLIALARRAHDLRLDLWLVAIAALGLAWLQRNAKARELKDYDAWLVIQARRHKKPWPSFRSQRRR